MPSSSTAVRSANETVWHAAGAALYAGDVDTFLTTGSPTAATRSPTRSPACPPSSAATSSCAQLFAGFAALAAWIGVDDVRFHATADPDVAFVEEHMTAELHDGGRYENDLCMRVTFRDGLIASIFEYYGERAHEDLLRRLGIGC